MKKMTAVYGSMFLVVVLLSFVSSWASAQALDPSAYSCRNLQAELNSRGALLLKDNWGWSKVHYKYMNSCDRYREEPVTAYERAADGWCQLGYICVEKHDHAD